MKTTEGLIRYDRLNEDCWIFDPGYLTIPVRTGMVMSIQLEDCFRRGELIETLDGGLSVVFPKGREYKLNPNKRYPARMAAKLVDELIDEVARWEEQNATDTPKTENDNETTDLPF